MTRIFLSAMMATTMMAGSALAQSSPPPAPPVQRNWNEINAQMHSMEHQTESDFDEMKAGKTATRFDDLGMKIARPDMKLLRAAEVRVNGTDGPAAKEALMALEPQMGGADARYVLGSLMIRSGAKWPDPMLQMKGTELVLASGKAAPAAQPALYNNLATLALQAGNMVRARYALAKLVELRPTDADALMTIGQIDYNGGDKASAKSFMERAIAAQQKNGKPVPAAWTSALAATR